jgi:hypothetical protein
VPHVAAVRTARSKGNASADCDLGVLSDAAVAADGWDIDNVILINASNAPFPEVIPNRPACNPGYLFSDRFESVY